MLMFCYFISIGLPLVFDQPHMEMIRKRLLLSILDCQPVVDPTLLPMLSDSFSGTSPPPKRSRLDDTSHESLPLDTAVPNLAQICNDDGGGNFTQEEKEDNDLASKIIDIGINARKDDEVGIDLVMFDAVTGKIVRPKSFGELNYVQQQIMIELFKQAINGRFYDGIRLASSEQDYARENGFHIQTIKSMINFVSLYKYDSHLYDRFRGDEATLSTASS